MGIPYLLVLALSLVTCSLSASIQSLFPAIDQQYVYNLKTNISAGTLVPVETSSHWTMEGKLHIQLSNYTVIRFRLDDVKASAFNKEEHLTSFLPSDAEALKISWGVKYWETGEVSGMLFAKDEPAWSANMKRALALNFQLQNPKRNGPLSFRLSEACLYGTCDVEYTSMDRNTVRKTQDVTAYGAGTGVYWWCSLERDYCTGRNKEPFIGTAERIYHLDEKHGLQDLDLRSILQYHSHNNLLSITTELSLTFDKVMHLDPDDETELNAAHVAYYPQFYKEPTNGRVVVTQEKLYNDTKMILLKIAKGIDAENIVRNSSIIHSLDFIDLHKAMSRLEYDWLKTLFEELALDTSYDVETCRNIYLEALPFVKTSASAIFIKYLVVERRLQRQLEDSILLTLVRKLPFNVANYSRELLDQMESITRLGPDFPEDLKYACILSFATLAYNTYKVNNYDSDYFDNIVVKYFKMYSDSPQYLDRMVWLQGLSNLQMGKVYTYLAPKIMSNSTNRHERYLGLMGTLPIVLSNPVDGTALSWPILTNENEHIQLRIAALTQLLSCNWTPGQVLALHQYISRCKNEQLKTFWYTSVKSLEKTTYRCFKSMAKLTSYVSKLVSPSDSRLWGTGNYIVDFSNDERSSAAMMQLVTVGDPQTGLPEVLHFNMGVSQGGLVTADIEVMLKAEGISLNLFRRFHAVDLEGISIHKLVELLKTMKVQTVNPKKVHIEIIAKVQGKTIYVSHMNQSRFERWNGSDLAQISELLLFGSHLNQQYVLYPKQIELNLATELGTPVTLQTTSSIFSSIRGTFNAPPTMSNGSWDIDVHFRYQATQVTSLSTFGPLLPSDHTVRIQQSMVAHLPLKFEVSLPKINKLKWRSPGLQNGGLAMHSRAQIEMTSPNSLRIFTVNTEDSLPVPDKAAIFFDCSTPMSGIELIEKLIDSSKSNYNLFTTLRAPVMMLHSLFILSVPSSGSCGLILPASRPHEKQAKNTVEVEVELQNFQFQMEEKLEFRLLSDVRFRKDNPGEDVYMNVSGLATLKATRDFISASVKLTGEQPGAEDVSRKTWKVCLRKQYSSHDSVEKDLSPNPSNYDGDFMVSFATGKVPEECPVNGSTFNLKYEGKPVPLPLKGVTERVLEIKASGEKLPKLHLLSETGFETETTLGRFLQKFDLDRFNVSAVITGHNGVTSIKVDQGPDLQFKSENFNWLLNNWSTMQVAKKYGIYRECRLQESTVHTLLGTVDRLPGLQCSASLALGDCSSIPRFALLRQQNGGYKLYIGGNYVSIEPSPIGAPVVRVNNEAVEYQNGYTYPINESIFDFKINRAGDGVKVHSRISGIILYYRPEETHILVPNIFLPIACGSCMSQHYYKLC